MVKVVILTVKQCIRTKFVKVYPELVTKLCVSLRVFVQNLLRFITQAYFNRTTNI